MLPLAATLPAFADEVAASATDAAAAAPGGTFGMSSTELAVAFSPLVIYGLFNLYREKINPRAKVRNFCCYIYREKREKKEPRP
jgi:hypothetical protein